VRLTCDQKLVKASLIYRTEPKQNRICKNSEQPESVVSVKFAYGPADATATPSSPASL